MNNRLEIAIGSKKLVVEINDWSDEAPKELCVFIVGEDGHVLQDICTIRECYIYQEKSGEWIRNDKFLDCFVYADSWDEDYTNKFCIGVYEEEE